MTITRLTAAILIALAALVIAPAPAQAMVVKSSATVEGPFVRLADLLAEPGEAGAQIVAAAPAPGEHANLSYHEIAAAARKAGLEDVELGRGYVEVRRAGRVVPEELIEDRLRTAFAARGVDGPLGLRLTGLRGALYVPLAADPSAVEIESLRHDGRSNRFEATLRLPDGPVGKHRRVSFTGIAEPQRRIPVLARAMSPGETVSEDDIAWTTLDERRVNRTMLVDARALIGREPVRPLRAEAPLRRSDLRRPRLVERGALVTMIASKGPMTLTAIGKAMQSGAKGEIIRLVNTNSNRTVEARVIGPDRVAVVTASALADAGR